MDVGTSCGHDPDRLCHQLMQSNLPKHTTREWWCIHLCVSVGVQRSRRAHISLLEAAEACLQVYGVAEELGSAHITPRRPTPSSPTPPSVHSIHPTFPPSAARRQRLRRSTGNSPSICFLHFCFSLPKGQVCGVKGFTVIRILFLPLISHHVLSRLEGKMLCQGLGAQSVSHVTHSDQREGELTALLLLTQPLCWRTRMPPDCAPTPHSDGFDKVNC